MNELRLAYCGLRCEDCPVFIATANDDDELRQRTAQDWSKIYAEHLLKLGMDRLRPEDMSCKGCRSESCLFIGCMNCPIRKCCQQRDLTTCAGCNDYESCELLIGFFSVILHEQAKDNLDRLRMKQRFEE